MEANIGFANRMTRFLIGTVILIIAACSYLFEGKYYYNIVIPIAILLSISALIGFCPVVSFFKRNK